MRDPADQATAELPILPGYKYPPSTQDNGSRRAMRQGYQGPKSRPRCETCLYVATYKHAIVKFRCTQGDFAVMRGGICQRYQRHGE